MAPKRRVEYDEYIPPVAPQAPLSEPPATVQEQHTEYERHQPTLHTFITVPNPEPLQLVTPTPSLTLLQELQDDQSSFPNQEVPPHSALDADDLDASREEHAVELEAAGLLTGHHADRTDKIKGKRRRTQAMASNTTMDNPLVLWVPYIDTYVDELLRLEGRGDCIKQTVCAQHECESSVLAPDYGFRCRDCQDMRLFCSECSCLTHMRQPFHRLQRWNGQSFEKVTLKSLGLRIQLGHNVTEVCPLPQRAFNDDFVIIDSDGIHEVSLDYCGCEQSIPKIVQLLRARLFPSTVIDPKTAATFRVLDTFQMLNFMSKTSAFEFYNSIARRTDNTGTKPTPDRYHTFMRMVREWRHVRMLKRAGRGHSESGVKGTQQGECAVRCPACPMPGVNLPLDWQQRPSKDQWLYSLFVGIDANFRLKRTNVSSDDRDPGLNHGYAYLVENTAFHQYLENFGEKIPDDKSTCNDHDAIKSASMKGGQGTAASGLGTVECARHDMKRPMAVGDLQKGERYVNMDYFLLSSLRFNTLTRIVISYDIACQWSKNLRARCSIYPENIIASSPNLQLLFLVPKFHLPAHIAKCQVEYSFNLLPQVGRTDGEAPERGWALANSLATSTREMGPGLRRDVLDDVFGDANWRKISAFIDSFYRKATEAIKARLEHMEAFAEFDVALPLSLTDAWTIACQAWEADRTKKNPFEATYSTMSDAEVRLQLARTDEQELSQGHGIPMHVSVAPAQFIYQGLEIEEQQFRLANDIAELGPHSTSLQQAKVLERSNALRRRIEAWVEIQHFYVPALAAIRARLDEGGGRPIAVQDIDLFLPSKAHANVTYGLSFLQGEFQLRHAHAKEALNTLRGQLLMRSMMTKSKDRHSRGQRQQTRSVKLLQGIEVKIQTSARRYRMIRAALVSLAVPLVMVGWEQELRVLEDRDMVGLTSLDDFGPEGRKKLTWIWTVQGTGMGADRSGQEALRIEWCKSRARAHRWQEECLLLDEEMRRVLATFKWESANWRALAQATEDRESFHGTPVHRLPAIEEQQKVREGKIAYAYRQAAIRDTMRENCNMKWKKTREQLLKMETFDAGTMIEHKVVPQSGNPSAAGGRTG